MGRPSLTKLGCPGGRPAVVSPAPKPGRCSHLRENKPNCPGSGGHIMCRQSRPSGVLPPPGARINSRFREVQQEATRRVDGMLGFGVWVWFFQINSWLPPSKQTATDSSSNSSQKREQPTRTISSPTSCEHRRIYTLGHLHDPYPTDHYHLEQVSGSLPALRSSGWGAPNAGGLLPLPEPRPLPCNFVPPPPHLAGGSSPLLRGFCVPDPLYRISFHPRKLPHKAGPRRPTL